MGDNLNESLLAIKLKIRQILPMRILIKHQFRNFLNRKLDLRNPVTYNEKLQWIKLNDHNPLYTQVVDKVETKSWAANLIGDKYIIPTLGVWDSVYDVKFEDLPDKFVIKATHDSGTYIVCDDKSKFDYQKFYKKFKKSLKHNFYYDAGEWPYKNVRPRIIAEEYIGFFPMDYKFFVFGGVIDSIMVCKGREFGHPDFYFYDLEWRRLIYQHSELEKDDDVERPENLEEMISIVEKLSKGFKHVRVDLYNVNGKIYYGECTFFDQGGYDTDITYETDLMWGEKINLEKR